MRPPAELLPELLDWNRGRGIEPSDWLLTFITSEQAVAYATLFWPSFLLIEEHVLRAPVNAESFNKWRIENRSVADRHEREALWNRLHINEDLFGAEDWTPLVDTRAVFIGAVLAEVHELKLARDFPDRRFAVEFWDGTQPEHGGGVSLSFWQKA
jgi:hypothetical protein